MAAEYPDEKNTTAAMAKSGAQEGSSPRPQQQGAPSSDDGYGSEAGEISGSTVDSGGGAPPLPDDAPPLPDDAFPDDDGWSHKWDHANNCFYFVNEITGKWQWENPRIPEATGYESYYRFVPDLEHFYSLFTLIALHSYANDAAPDMTTTSGAPSTSITSGAPGTSPPRRRLHGGYNPAIHGSYDPKADYALEAQREEEEAEAAAQAAAAAANAAAAASLANGAQDYTTAAHFNRFTGKFQDPSVNPDNHNDANKSRRQMNAFFDVDAAANAHDGRSLKAERRSKPLSKKEIQAYNTKRREKKEAKRRAWLLE